jgi:hypothetical protein
MTVLCPMLIVKNGGIMSGPPNNGYYVALIHGLISIMYLGYT